MLNRERPLNIVAISDTHQLHGDLLLPAGDLLIHAGDITFFSHSPAVLKEFNGWLGAQPQRYKVVIPGNHDSLLLLPEHQRTITNAHLLINSGIELGGLRIWGSPVTTHAGVAFGTPDPDERARLWASIPTDLDVLITHVPPYKVLDSAPGEPDHAGCPQLRAAVIRKRPTLHVFGHVHAGYGAKPTTHTMFVNAALLGAQGDLDKRPITLTMCPRAAIRRS